MFVILAYHNVVTFDPHTPRRLYVSASAIRRQFEAIASSGLARTLDDAITRDEPSIVVTFDDGYRNFAELAMPVVHEFGVPVTLYVSLGLLGRRQRQNGNIVDFMTVNDVRACELTALVRAESHGYSHTSLTELSGPDLDLELTRSGALFRRHFGRRPSHFCYPFGHSDLRVESRIAASGYVSAVTTVPGINRFSMQRHRLKRIAAVSTWGSQEVAALVRALG